MPYDEPVTTQQSTTRTVTARHGQVGLSIAIVVEGAASETDGDTALQRIVDALSRSAHFTAVSGAKTYVASQTRAMQPST